MNSAFEPCARCGDTFLLSELNDIYLCDSCAEDEERIAVRKKSEETEEDEQD